MQRSPIAADSSPTAASVHLADNSISEPVIGFGNSIPGGDKEGGEDGNRAENASAWQALVSEELERKKLELFKKDAVLTDAFTGPVAPLDQQEDVTCGTESDNLLHKPVTGRGRKYKFLKSAGVGSIVALLRAQQAL